ncbi:probable protein phosphatase 2C 12 [Rutidosis leptorrhynchoides]|uniref:probable protein phosphatase 2C 12 n=1 Tax=Rutidosis leptorrhynchoides TaxID=125765 RepID=UPI003A990BD9
MESNHTFFSVCINELINMFESIHTSGTTVTFVITEGSIVTVASVGDSRCILESANGAMYYLSADHRLDTNEQERERVTASGGEVGRLNTGGDTDIFYVSPTLFDNFFYLS